MLAVKLICVGKLKESYWRDAVAEYEKRLRPLCKVRSPIDRCIGSDTDPIDKGQQNLHRHEKEQIQSGSPQRSQNALCGIGMLGFHIFPLLVRP